MLGFLGLKSYCKTTIEKNPSHKLDTLQHTCIPTCEVEEERPGVQGHLLLVREPEASLAYLRSRLKETKRK